jgi:hypothetical protein
METCQISVMRLIYTNVSPGIFPLRHPDPILRITNLSQALHDLNTSIKVGTTIIGNSANKPSSTTNVRQRSRNRIVQPVR